MSEWSFRDYLNASGRNLIRAWLVSLPKAVQAKIDVRLLTLAGSDVWPPQYVSALKGCDDIYELRIVHGGVQYRPLGCHGPGRREFTLLLGVVEKGRLPLTCYETAKRRRNIILSDRSRTCEHQYAAQPNSGEGAQ
jgi:hypothetical protein